jgi:hypothetical protein
MLYRSFGFAMSACLCGALFAGCAGGGSSVTQSAGTVPSAVQREIAPGDASAGRQAQSGIRRTMSEPACSTNGNGAFVGGGTYNVAGGGVSFVGAGTGNQACDGFSGIVAGEDNAVSGTTGPFNSFIGGGEENIVTGSDLDSAIVAGNTNTVSNDESAIVGGHLNTVSSEYGFIGGGNTNTVSGSAAVIAGGQGSYAEGEYATVPGGYDNNAAGELSFAAGFKSYAHYAGSFVWSDYASGATLLESTGVNQFLARATGGFTLWTNAANTVGAKLAPGSGTWASASDRNLKTDVARIDDAAVLDKVVSLPISRWSYKSERGVRHVGPMAQDFYAAFGVGEDDKHITSIDEDGVALAAIKALHAESANAHSAIQALHARDADAHAAIAALHAENARLRRRLASVVTSQASMQLELRRLTAKVDADGVPRAPR